MFCNVQLLDFHMTQQYVEWNHLSEWQNLSNLESLSAETVRIFKTLSESGNFCNGKQ